MPIYGHGLIYGSPTNTYKDAYVVPESGSFPTFQGLGQASESAIRTGKIVSVAILAGAVALFVATVMLGKKG